MCSPKTAFFNIYNLPLYCDSVPFQLVLFVPCFQVKDNIDKKNKD
jgi:hypothetical protein